jgi:integrase
MTAWRSVFAESLKTYVQLRRRLGWVFTTQAETLRRFDRFADARQHHGALTADLVQAFAVSDSGISTKGARKRYMTVRGFAEYLATIDPRTPQLDPAVFAERRRRRARYVFTDDELGRLLDAAATYSPHHQSRNVTLHAIVGLAAACGLRLREVIALNVADVDLVQGVLTIRHSKFDKDRLVPVHATTLESLRAYAAMRKPWRPLAIDPAFFLSMRRHRFTAPTIDDAFHHLVRRIPLHPPVGAPPTFYSLRHTFAVRRLIEWHRAGADVQALLPALGLDPVSWTSFERWIRCPDRWQTHPSAGRAGDSMTTSSPRLSGSCSTRARAWAASPVTSI